MSPDEPCLHMTFTSEVKVIRLTDDPSGSALPHSFRAEVRISCADCDERFRFLGVPVGVDPRHPAASPDRTELRVPMQPETSLRDLAI